MLHPGASPFERREILYITSTTVPVKQSKISPSGRNDRDGVFFPLLRHPRNLLDALHHVQSRPGVSSEFCHFEKRSEEKSWILSTESGYLFRLRRSYTCTWKREAAGSVIFRVFGGQKIKPRNTRNNAEGFLSFISKSEAKRNLEAFKVTYPRPGVSSCRITGIWKKVARRLPPPHLFNFTQWYSSGRSVF